MSVPFIIFLALTFFAFTRITAYAHAKKGRETLEHAIRSATFPVDEYIVDTAGKNAFLINSTGSKLLMITINDSGAAHTTRITAHDIAGARIVEGTRTIAEAQRGRPPRSYPSGDEVKRYLPEVSESAFKMLDGQFTEGDRRGNAESFYRLVAAMYLQRYKGIARPSEEEIQDMLPHMRAKSLPFTSLRVELDVYQDGARSDVGTYAVSLPPASVRLGMGDPADSSPIERARAWHRRMIRALEQSAARATTPQVGASHGGGIHSSIPAAAPAAALSSEVSDTDTAETYAAESDSRSIHADDEDASMDAPHGAAGASFAPAFEGGDVREAPERRIDARAPRSADLSVSQATDTSAAIVPELQETEAVFTMASTFEDERVEVPPAPKDEDPYKALLERVRAPVSESPPDDREDDFESEWARQRAKVFGKNDAP